MAQKNFLLAPLGKIIAASWVWNAAAVGLEPGVLPPIFITGPSISGIPAVGQTLTGAVGTISGGGVSARQWLRNGAAISGATAATYVLVTADIDATITFRVTAAGSGGTAVADSAGFGPIAAPTPFSAVAADGWQVTVASPTDLTLTPFLVSRAGFDATGAATTYYDVLRLTKRVRQAFPSQASFTATSVAVSDYIYAADTISGATNNSTVVSPKPIATWGMMDRTLVGNSIAWEIIPFHRDARLGRQVACVRVRATDGTNTTAWQAVSTVTVSSSCETPQQPEVFAGTLDITALNNDSLITLQGEVYPWFGVSGSVLASNTETEFRFTNRFFYKNTTLVSAPNIICVSSTGNDSTGVVSTNEATARATPCLTVGGAINRAASLLGTGTRNILSGLEVRVMDGVAMGTVPFAFINQDAAAIKVTRATTATRSSANITMSVTLRPYSAGNDKSPQLTESSITFEDLTITRTADVEFLGEGSRQMHVQFRNVAFNFSSVGAASGMKSNSHLSVFGMTVTNYTSGFNFTSSGDNRILRGLSGSFNNIAIDGSNLIGGSLAATFVLNTPAQRGMIVYNNSLPSVPSGNNGITMAATTAGQSMYGAIVQNVVPNITTGGNASFLIAGDSANGNITHLVMHHNTSAGVGIYGRYNVVYDDTPGTARTHTLVSFKGNLGPQINTKGDVFMSDGARLGNFPFHHGVGCTGDFARGLDAGGGGLSFGQAYAGIGSVINGGTILFVDDRATTAGPVAGTTGGNYDIQSGSPAKNLFSGYLLARDYAGAARSTSGTVDAGAYA